MFTLEQTQQAVMQALASGPDYVPDTLFAGHRSAALRGLSVHANTISHARLVALEDTFPRTWQGLGDGAFNLLSRSYLHETGTGALTLARIGRDFPDWLAAQGQAEWVADLARFEWRWLECYHAPEAPAFDLAGLAGLGEAGIAELVLACHPASAVVRLDCSARALLADEAATRFDLTYILITRSGADVRIAALSDTGARLHAALAEPQLVCNLLADATEPDGQDALFALIANGALVRDRGTHSPW